MRREGSCISESSGRSVYIKKKRRECYERTTAQIESAFLLPSSRDVVGEREIVEGWRVGRTRGEVSGGVEGLCCEGGHAEWVMVREERREGGKGVDLELKEKTEEPTSGSLSEF